MTTYFITGTDTEIGKTTVTLQLLQHAQQRKMTTIGIKPLASGAHNTPNGLKNDDALALQEASSVQVDYEFTNPVVLPDPIAPNICAQQHGVELSSAVLLQQCAPSLEVNCDLKILEGIGGWYCPLNDRETMADFVAALQVQVILVVGLRLGCLNHALLTQRAILESGVPWHGWIANHLQPDMPVAEDNIATLTQHLQAPHLATLPYQGTLVWHLADYL